MDKRTLEMAAKAAGIECEWKLGANYKQILVLSRNKQRFDPVNDTYDFFQLAEKIEAEIDFRLMCVTARDHVEWATDHNNSIQEALVALAARIGEAMP